MATATSTDCVWVNPDVPPIPAWVPTTAVVTDAAYAPGDIRRYGGSLPSVTLSDPSDYRIASLEAKVIELEEHIEQLLSLMEKAVGR